MPNFTPIGAVVRIGPQKRKFVLIFDQNVEFKRPAGGTPCATFIKFAEFVPRFSLRELLKISLDLLKGLWNYGGFKLRGLATPEFSAPPSGETMHQTPKVLEVQERARGPLSPRQI